MKNFKIGDKIAVVVNNIAENGTVIKIFAEDETIFYLIRLDRAIQNILPTFMVFDNNYCHYHVFSEKFVFEQKKDIKIAGHTVEFQSDSVKVGCTTVKIEEIKKLVSELKNRGQLT